MYFAYSWTPPNSRVEKVRQRPGAAKTKSSTSPWSFWLLMWVITVGADYLVGIFAILGISASRLWAKLVGISHNDTDALILYLLFYPEFHCSLTHSFLHCPFRLSSILSHSRYHCCHIIFVSFDILLAGFISLCWFCITAPIRLNAYSDWLNEI